MSYKLDPLLPMSESVRRVALAELEYAESALRSASDRHGGIHSARKCLKRLRSLLTLIRPGLPDPVFAWPRLPVFARFWKSPRGS